MITNGQITAGVYLPDAKAGFYRSTRFDWSGAIGALEYKGHQYYGPWFTKVTDIYDFGYDGPEDAVVSAEFTAMVGPAEEFGAIGYNEAAPGGLFVKPGIGVLRRADDTPYNHSKPYEIANGGKWDVKRSRDAIEFRHTVSEPALAFGYVYTKTIRLTRGQPQMTIEHSLQNTGTKPMQTNVYNHNFMTLDGQPPGPDYDISVPFQLQRAQRGARPVPSAAAPRRRRTAAATRPAARWPWAQPTQRIAVRAGGDAGVGRPARQSAGVQESARGRRVLPEPGSAASARLSAITRSGSRTGRSVRESASPVTGRCRASATGRSAPSWRSNHTSISRSARATRSRGSGPTITW